VSKNQIGEMTAGHSSQVRIHLSTTSNTAKWMRVQRKAQIDLGCANADLEENAA
jgi:hypothetical protein